MQMHYQPLLQTRIVPRFTDVLAQALSIYLLMSSTIH
jgi:hypothetical protein